MGRGSSKVSGGAAFGGIMNKSGFEYSGGWRTETTEWQAYMDSFGPHLTDDDNASIRGYVGTGSAFSLNESFYAPDKRQRTDAMQKTADNLDRLVDSHQTPADGYYTRYVDDYAIPDLLGLTKDQTAMLSSANESNIADFNKALSGSTMFSPAYTSVAASASTDYHVFSNRMFRREISAPKGTKALAVKNSSETEVVFGRNMHTVLDHVSYDANARNGHGQIVLHERFVKYDK